MAKKKYLLVLPSFMVGGAEKQAFSFAEYLKERGYDVTLTSLGMRGPICESCEQSKIRWDVVEKPNVVVYDFFRCLERVHLLPKTFRTYNEALSIRLAKYIKKEQFDYCVAYCIESCVLLGRAAKYYHRPRYVWFQRDAGIFNTGDDYERNAIRACDLVLSNGISGKQYLESHFDISVKVINNGVKLAKAKYSNTEWRYKLRASDDTIICTMIANLHDAKDHISLLKIWDALHHSCDGNMPTLVFAGRFDNKYSELIDYTNKHGLQDYVQFIGPTSDVTGLLSATDICVFGAKSEGSPNGIIEAALMALPVFATNLPEIREIVSDDNIPLLFEREDVDDSKRKMQLLLEDANLRKRIGKENLEKAQVKYDRNRNFNKIIDLIER